MTCIWEVPSSVLGQVTSYHDLRFIKVLPQSLQGNAKTVFIPLKQTMTDT